MAQLYDAGPRAALDLGDVADDASDATTEEDPQTVEAFVRRMRKESRQLGDVFLAEDEAENSKRRSTASDLPETKETMPVEWARSVLADFSDLRLALEAHAAQGVGRAVRSGRSPRVVRVAHGSSGFRCEHCGLPHRPWLRPVAISASTLAHRWCASR